MRTYRVRCKVILLISEAEASSQGIEADMRNKLELPRLSLQERDRRWSTVREEMKQQGLDCLVLCGFPGQWDFTLANARFLSPIAGNAEFNFLIFPAEGEPTSFVLMPTFLQYWARAQDWVKDIRPRRGTWAGSVVSRLKELGLEKKRIGVDGLAGPLDPDGWFPSSVYTSLLKLVPGATFVNTNDMMERIRMVKSLEEIDFLRKAAHLGDLMLETCVQASKPGVRECEVYGKMVEVMLGNGGEEPTLFLWTSDAHPLPHPFRLPTMRPLEKGDMIICEMHPKYGGYCTHLERTFCLGEPEKEYLEIYEGCLAAYTRGMDLFMPGTKITEAMNDVKEVIGGKKLGFCEAGIHGHGLSSLEYPRYRHHAPGADAKALELAGDEFKPGMVFAFNIDLVNPAWRKGETGCVFAETVLVTEGKPERLHGFSTDFQIIGKNSKVND
ncbi:MAG: Xaa-Pro peptidase family protein [Deltaproteobacteria bacterium]